MRTMKSICNRSSRINSKRRKRESKISMSRDMNRLEEAATGLLNNTVSVHQMESRKKKKIMKRTNIIMMSSNNLLTIFKTNPMIMYQKMKKRKRRKIMNTMPIGKSQNTTMI